MEQTGVDEVTNMEVDASRLWFTSLVSGATVCIDKIVMCIALIVFRIGWWATIYCQQILLGMLTIFGPIQWAFSLLPKWEGAWAKWMTRYLTVHFYGAMLYFVGFLCPASVRHCAVHTGGEPDGDNDKRADDGSLSAKLLLLGRLSDGGKHCSPEMPEPCAGPGGMDDTGG